ncbi:MAG: nucleotidyltransferase family protein [Actinobacteria bacterium]|nr:nucleotidyltransferase family protein [Actinomycetota bacterium]
MKVAGILLCAGQGSRFSGNGHKLLQQFGSTTLFEHCLSAMMDAELDLNIVVDGAVDLSSRLPTQVVRVHNPDWIDGMATSLKVGVACAKELGASSVVVGLGDQPGILGSSWRAVANSSGRPIAIATYHGKRRNPVRLDSTVWELLPTTGDVGARALVKLRPELVEEVDCLGDPRDIDTLEDLIRWNS